MIIYVTRPIVTTDLDYIARLLRLPALGGNGGHEAEKAEYDYQVRVYRQGCLEQTHTVQAIDAGQAIALVEQEMGIKNQPAISHDSEGKQIVAGWSGYEFRARRLAPG